MSPLRRAAGPGGAGPHLRAGRPAAGRGWSPSWAPPRCSTAAGRGARRSTTLRTDVAARLLRRSTPSATWPAPTGCGIRFVVPGDDEWPHAARRPGVGRAVQQRGGPPLGLWVRGPLRLDELPLGGRGGSRSATTYGAERGGRGRRGAGAGRAGRGLGSGVRDRPGGPPRCPGGRRTRPWRCWPAAWTAPTRPRTGACSTTSRRRELVVSELAPGCAPTRLRFLARNRLIAGAHPRHGGGRGGAAQRGAEHRQLGRAAEPAADGRARTGHQRAVAGRAPADPLAARPRW